MVGLSKSPMFRRTPRESNLLEVGFREEISGDVVQAVFVDHLQQLPVQVDAPSCRHVLHGDQSKLVLEFVQILHYFVQLKVMLPTILSNGLPFGDR